jgi:hypothetical protein
VTLIAVQRSRTKVAGKHGATRFDIIHKPNLCFDVEIVCARGGDSNTMKTRGGIYAPLLTLYYYKGN